MNMHTVIQTDRQNAAHARIMHGALLCSSRCDLPVGGIKVTIGKCCEACVAGGILGRGFIPMVSRLAVYDYPQRSYGYASICMTSIFNDLIENTILKKTI